MAQDDSNDTEQGSGFDPLSTTGVYEVSIFDRDITLRPVVRVRSKTLSNDETDTESTHAGDATESTHPGNLSEQTEEILSDIEESMMPGAEEVQEQKEKLESSDLKLAPDIVPEILDELEISHNSNVSDAAMKLAVKHGTTGDNLISGAPSSIAAASVYTAGLLRDKHRPQEEIAQAAGVSEATIRDNFHELLETLSE